MTYGATMSTTFGSVLKEWRGVRRMSQLELGSLAEVSPRHISFMESGRSKPSRPMVLHLTNVLEVPRAERNRFLGAAGYAPIYRAQDLEAPEMDQIRDAISWTLQQHDPFPAIVLDRHWNILQTNNSASMMFAMLSVDSDGSLLDVFLQDSDLKKRLDNWSEVGYFLLTRLRTESAALGGDAVLDAAIAQLVGDEEISPPSGAQLAPVLPAVFQIDDLRVSLFSTIAHFGSAEDIALADHRIELFFPADTATRELLASLG